MRCFCPWCAPVGGSGSRAHSRCGAVRVARSRGFSGREGGLEREHVRAIEGSYSLLREGKEEAREAVYRGGELCCRELIWLADST